MNGSLIPNKTTYPTVIVLLEGDKNKTIKHVSTNVSTSLNLIITEDIDEYFANKSRLEPCIAFEDVDAVVGDNS